MCSLTLHSHPAYWRPHRELIAYHASPSGLGEACLLHDSPCPCQYPDFGNTAHKQQLDARRSTADEAILQRLVATCRSTEDAAHADAFLVPYPFGTASTLHQLPGVGATDNATSNVIRALRHGGGDVSIPRAVLRAWLKTLPHLDAATEAKHLVLWTSDDAEAALDGAAQRMQLIHAAPALLAVPARTAIVNSIVVPPRISHLLPLGNPPPYAPHRRWLLFGSRHAMPHKLFLALNATAQRMGVRERILLAEGTTTPTVEAAVHASASTFCLCPVAMTTSSNHTEDAERQSPPLQPSTSFWFAIAHGCIPVRWYLLQPNAGATGTFEQQPPSRAALPFSHRIDWRRAAVDVGVVRDEPRHRRLSSSSSSSSSEAHVQLLQSLLGMPQEEVSDRLHYVRHIAPLVLYRGGPGGAPPAVGRDDAASLAIEELERRLIGPRSRSKHPRDEAAGTGEAPSWENILRPTESYAYSAPEPLTNAFGAYSYADATPTSIPQSR